MESRKLCLFFQINVNNLRLLLSWVNNVPRGTYSYRLLLEFLSLIEQFFA